MESGTRRGAARRRWDKDSPGSEDWEWTVQIMWRFPKKVWRTEEDERKRKLEADGDTMMRCATADCGRQSFMPETERRDGMI